MKKISSIIGNVEEKLFNFDLLTVSIHVDLKILTMNAVCFVLSENWDLFVDF